MSAELETQLQNALTQEPHNAVETAITVYLMAKAQLMQQRNCRYSQEIDC